MLPLPPFTFHTPHSLGEAVTLLSQFGGNAALIAGGTDLLPNMKHGLASPQHLISLSHLGQLQGVSTEGAALRIGSMTTLEVVAEHPLVREHANALAEAARSVGAPSHRRMGTLGGNLCLDTRCRYYNQTQFWRQALGYCLKKDGDVCHVVPGGKRCVAAACNDTAAPALALEASLVLHGPQGQRRVAASDFFVADGARNISLSDGELLVALELPLRLAQVSVYEKLRRRGAIDFPLLSVAVRLDGAVSGPTSSTVTDVAVVVSALAAKPRVINAAQRLGVGRSLDQLPLEELAQAALRECNPLPNIEGDDVWRKQMVAVMVKRALRRAVEAATQARSTSCRTSP